LRCELRALLQDLGARDGDTLSASLGSVVHAIAASAPAGASPSELEALLDQHWPELDFGPRWHAENERQRASGILAALLEWLAASRQKLELVDVERGFRAQVGDAVLTGRVDRLERDGHGRLVVVDLKTTKSRVKPDDLSRHPQLGAYQLAVEAGAFGAGEASGGAALVQLAARGRSGPEQWQPPLAETDDPSWIRDQVAEVAARLRGSEFTATVNAACGYCDLRASCPVSSEGRQVTA
jgi:RecB family exonuclease